MNRALAVGDLLLYNSSLKYTENVSLECLQIFNCLHGVLKPINL